MADNQFEDTAEEIAAARAQGWRPEEEWDEARAEREGRRKPKSFISAKEFLERTNNNLPVLNERLHTATRKLEEERKLRLEETKRIDEMHQILSDQQRMSKDAIARARSNGRKEAEDAMDRAVVEGDTQALKDAKERLKTIHNEELEEVKASVAPKPAAQKPEAGKATPVIERWVSENPWFQSDAVRKAAMIENHQAVLKEFPTMDEWDQLEEAHDRTRNELPHRFGAAEAAAEAEPVRRSATVSRPSFARGGKDNAESRFSALPKEDREAYERMKRRFKADRNTDYSIKEYMQEYEQS